MRADDDRDHWPASFHRESLRPVCDRIRYRTPPTHHPTIRAASNLSTIPRRACRYVRRIAHDFFSDPYANPTRHNCSDRPANTELPVPPDDGRPTDVVRRWPSPLDQDRTTAAFPASPGTCPVLLALTFAFETP